jgi:hypothetical protein
VLSLSKHVPDAPRSPTALHDDRGAGSGIVCERVVWGTPFDRLRANEGVEGAVRAVSAERLALRQAWGVMR